MATSYSTNLALALPATGELSGTWGTTVNTNITNMLDEALGYQAYSATGGADTITIPDGTTGVARSIYIQLNGTGGGSVAVPTTKTKMYFVFNNTASAITFKVTGQTGVSIPAAAKMALVSNGTDVIVAQNYFATLTLGAALPVLSGGTGVTTSTGTGSVVLNTSPTFVTPILGTPTSATLTNATGLPISTGVSGLGTGIATALAVNVGTAGSPVVNGGALGTPSSGTVTNLTGTASININGTVGATTASTGAFTSLTASTTLGVTGVSTLTGGAVVQGLTVGRGAGAVSTNTVVGSGALAANSSGSSNSAYGLDALALNTTGSSNTAIGRNTLLNNLTGGSNTATGVSALITNTGSYNSAFGSDALYSNTTASYNTAVGYQAGYSNTTGANNVATGDFAAYSNTTGERNAVYGSGAFYANTTGSYNTVVGMQALTNNTTASYNTAIGYQAAYSQTTVQGNTAVGHTALKTNTGGDGTAAIGAYSLQANTTGDKNTALGSTTLYANTTGSYNVAIGHSALQANTTASYNTAVGYQAGYINTTGAGNTFVGNQAGYTSNTTGNVFNTFIGASSGGAVTTGTKNTILGVYNGNQGGLDIRTASNYIVLSDGDGNPQGVFDSSGNLLVGATSLQFTSRQEITQTGTPAVALFYKNNTDVNPAVRVWSGGATGAATATQIAFLRDTGAIIGSITSTVAVTTYNTTSDYRLKTVVGPVVGAGQRIDALKPIDYLWKEGNVPARGFLAHEFQEVYAGSVSGIKDAVDADGKPMYQAMQASTSEVIADLVAELQSLRARVAQLESKL